MRFDAFMTVTFKVTLLWDVMHLPDYRQHHILKMDIFKTLLPQHTNIYLKNIKVE